MLIFSYLWTVKEAPKMIKQINSKANQVISENQFREVYSKVFAKNMKTATYPRNDMIFDDFMDLEMQSSKETQIHSFTCYCTSVKVMGFEIEYFLDGGRLRHVSHIKNQEQKKVANVQEGKMVNTFKKGMQNLSQPKQMFAKKSVYFLPGEYIESIKLKGNNHINKITMRTNF